ncbi:MAG: hypothetical protein ACI4F5_06595 [Acutalibacteraceae bacterium]
MTIYKVYREERIEAKTLKQAEESLLEQNDETAEVKYTTDRSEAMTLFERMKSTLGEPKYLGNNLYWFDGCLIEEATGCDDVDEDTTIEEAFLSATNFGADCFVRCED